MESKRGTAIVGYFEFFRYVFFLNLLLAAFMSLVLLLPVGVLSDKDFFPAAKEGDKLQAMILGGGGPWSSSFMFYRWGSEGG